MGSEDEWALVLAAQAETDERELISLFAALGILFTESAIIVLLDHFLNTSQTLPVRKAAVKSLLLCSSHQMWPSLRQITTYIFDDGYTTALFDKAKAIVLKGGDDMYDSDF